MGRRAEADIVSFGIFNEDFTFNALRVEGVTETDVISYKKGTKFGIVYSIAASNFHLDNASVYFENDKGIVKCNIFWCPISILSNISHTEVYCPEKYISLGDYSLFDKETFHLPECLKPQKFSELEMDVVLSHRDSHCVHVTLTSDSQYYGYYIFQLTHNDENMALKQFKIDSSSEMHAELSKSFESSWIDQVKSYTRNLELHENYLSLVDVTGRNVEMPGNGFMGFISSQQIKKGYLEFAIFYQKNIIDSWKRLIGISRFR